MNIVLVAGFGPITADPTTSRAFWGGHLGLPIAEIAPEYWGTDDLDGVNAFAIWPLADAAESTFGTREWPADLPTPTTWMELDLENPEAVVAAAAEMEASGHRLLKQAGMEPWGQTTARLLSPEGLLLGLTFTPWMHEHHEHDHHDHDHDEHDHERHEGHEHHDHQERGA